MSGVETGVHSGPTLAESNRVRAAQSLTPLAGITLAWNVVTILWGAVVRATGSGAGCGAHWPTCKGEVIPFAPTTATLIEYSHRLTSGVALILVAWLCFATLKKRPMFHPARFFAGASLFFIVTEALIGAGLVLFEKVATDKSLARGVWVSGHLVNTFLLLAALTLTLRFVSARKMQPPEPFGALRRAFPAGAAFPMNLIAAFAMILTAVSGAIAALGDTLFPSASLAEGLARDFSGASHLFLRLRVFHPFIAIFAGGLILFVAYRTLVDRTSRSEHRRAASGLAWLVLGQWVLGVANFLLLAPTILQIAHLLVADLIWIALILRIAEPAD